MVLDDFGAVWTQVRRVFRLLEACKIRCKKRRFYRGLDAGVQNPMQKGAVWTQVRRVFRFPVACKTECKKRRFYDAKSDQK